MAAQGCGPTLIVCAVAPSMAEQRKAEDREKHQAARSGRSHGERLAEMRESAHRMPRSQRSPWS